MAHRLETLLRTLRTAISEDYCISIQTNGILISGKILDLCSEFKTSISVSLDGPEITHDANRVGYRGDGTFHRVLKGIEKLKPHPDASFLFAGLLAVIDPNSNSCVIYNFFKSIGTSNIDFLYRMVTMTSYLLEKTRFTAQNTEFG